MVLPMARAGVIREQVFEAADALVNEGQSPTVVAVRTRLGGAARTRLLRSCQAVGRLRIPNDLEARASRLASLLEALLLAFW
jgi:hypothetical protein